jgi:hypothetical protein
MLTVAGSVGWLPRVARAAALSLPGGTVAEQVLEALPGKVPLIKKTYRPPNYETPISYFQSVVHAQRCLLRPLSLVGHPGSG